MAWCFGTRWSAGLGIVGAALLVTATSGVAVGVAPLQTGAATAEAAAKASPELVGALSKELGATPEQAAGAAGALFGLAKSRLTGNEFSQISTAVPGMDALLKAAPAAGAVAGTTGGGALSKAAGMAGGLAPAADAFTKLGLKPDQVAKAVPVLTSFVTKSGGADAGRLLAGALK